MKTYMKQYMTPEQNRIYWRGYFYGAMMGISITMIIWGLWVWLAL